MTVTGEPLAVSTGNETSVVVKVMVESTPLVLLLLLLLEEVSDADEEEVSVLF